MSKSYSIGGVDYHLLKRKSKTGKAIYYVGFLSDMLGSMGGDGTEPSARQLLGTLPPLGKSPSR